MTVDFVIKENLGRYAYPVSVRGKEFFDENLGQFDLSEEGWELDTGETDFSEFIQLMLIEGLGFEDMT
jgi:hypothetical protein